MCPSYRPARSFFRWMALLATVSLVASLSLLSSTSRADLVPPQAEVTNCTPKIIDSSEGGEITGSSCDDLIVADAETESIDGGAGNDVVFGDAGVDDIDGGLGDDTLYANGANIVFGGPNDDVIYGDDLPEPGTAAAQDLSVALHSIKSKKGTRSVNRALRIAHSRGVHLHLIGTPTTGDDVLIGEQGNDTINGLAGNDRIYGNIGDDDLSGSYGADLLAGGHGADYVYGQDGADTVRGDGSVDHLYGNDGTDDTISFASAATPGFTVSLPESYTGFPSSTGERGVYVSLASGNAYNGSAADGGGNDSPPNGQISGFENVIGSPYSDYIEGDSGPNTIDGGGGSDVIKGFAGDDAIFGMGGGDNLMGNDGPDTINGGPGVDYCVNADTTSVCNEAGASSSAVTVRDSGKVAVGFIARQRTGGYPTKYLELYLKGSTSADTVNVTYTSISGSPDTVKFQLSGGSFDTDESEETEDCDYTNANSSPKRVVCSFSQVLDMINIYGGGNGDTLTLASTGIPMGTNVILMGGDGGDTINGSDTGYDVLVDGIGNDTLNAGAKDDELINSDGLDHIYGEEGSDLLQTSTLCDGDVIGGGSGAGEWNTASWAQLTDDYPNGVGVNLADGSFGNRSSSGPSCSSGLGTVSNIDGLEGSKFRDGLTGGGGNNTLLGRNMGDWLNGGAGNDTLTGWTQPNDQADSDDNDEFTGGDGNDTIYARDDVGDVSVSCGAGNDSAQLDYSAVDDFTPTGCESAPRG